ncbi:restriction endonuclease subunit S [Pediococcus pentosaceus]|uniref:restriction endonuclease subunit S n=1 Tax=Pediococcus pentosaceus TaxID=1255 RepID=UPI003F24A7C4
MCDFYAWVLRKLGEVIKKLYNGQTPSRNHLDFWNGDIPWLTSGELNHSVVLHTTEHINIVGKKSSNLKIVPSGTFVMAITGLEASGTRGNSAILGLDTTINQSVMALFPNSLLNTNFLFQWYQKIGDKYGIRYTQGTKQQSYNSELIKILPITMPYSLKEQQAIGLLLKKIDDFIALQQRKIDNLKMLKKALLQQLFPEKGKDIPRVRFTDFTNRWKQRKLNNLYKSVNEKNDLTLTKDRIISVAKMQWGKALIESTDKYMRTYNVMRIGDIAFEGNKSKFFKYGRLVENTIGDGLISHVFVVFRPLKKMNLSYWKYFIHDENIMHNVLRMSTTKATMMTNLVTKDFLKQQIFVPNKSEQQKIGELLDFLSSKIKLSEQELNNFEHSKKALLQKMFI